MENMVFRTAVYGFRRKDVMAYLETIMQERAEALEACRRERETAAQEAACRLEREVRARRAAELKAEALQEERERAMEQWELQKEELDALQTRAAALQAALEESQQALAREQDRTARLSAEAGSYAAVKDRLSNIELAAHQRAAEVERAAELEAENIQRKARDNVLSLQMQYELAVSAMDTGRRQVTERLCEMQTVLDTLGPVLEQAGQTLVNLCEERCKPQKQQKEQEAEI
ncbi:MAG: hypothetical protein IIY71_00950 [Oscillospiraceae bacterium]|nr:hypothetical protein [Oscillospiraceae bacterium]